MSRTTMPIRRVVWMLFGVIILSMLLAACGDAPEEELEIPEDEESTDSGEPLEEDIEEEEEAEEDVEEEEGESEQSFDTSAPVLEIYNSSGGDICVVLVSSSDATEWGDNLLSDTLAADDGFTHDVGEEGEYDVHAEDCDGNIVQEEIRNYIAGYTIWEIGGAIYAGEGGEEGDEDEIAAVTAEAPEGDLISDTGFRPTADGFNFPNFGGEYDPDSDMTSNELVEIFGEGVCASFNGDTCVLYPSGQQFLEMVNEGTNGGHCAGFSVQAMRTFAGAQSPDIYGASTVYEIEQGEDIMHDITRDAGLQYLPEVAQYTIEGSPAELVNLFMERNEPMEVGIYGDEGGHSVVAYAVRDMGNNIYHLLSYDNNYPGQETYIEVDMEANTWAYSLAALNPAEDTNAWGGGAGDQTMNLVPTDAYTADYQCQFCSGMAPSGIFARQVGEGGTVYVSSPYAGDIQSSVDPSGVIRPRGVRTYSGQPVYLFSPEDEIDLSISGTGKATDNLNVRVFGQSFGLILKGLNNGGGVTEQLTFSEANRQGSYHSGGGQQPVITMISAGDDGDWFVASFTGADFGEGAGLNLGIDPETGAMILDGEGLEDTSFDFILAHVSEDGTDLFAYTDLGLTDAGNFGLDIENWDGEGSLGLLIDEDGDGEFEGGEDLDDVPLSDLMEGFEDSDDVSDLFGTYAGYMDEEDAAEFLDGLEGLDLSDEELADAIEEISDNSDIESLDEAEEEAEAADGEDESGADAGEDDGAEDGSGDDGSGDDGSGDDTGGDTGGDDGSGDDGGSDG